MALLLAALVLAGGCETRPPDAPSVLLVTIDTCRSDRLGAFGRRAARTPNLDRLARRSAVFQRAYAHCPLTLPSHVSIFTGLEPASHGVRDNGIYRLGEEAVTLTDALRAAGYRTAAFIGGFPLAARFGLAQSFDLYDDDLSVDPRPKQGFVYSERRAEYVTEAALRWVRAAPARRPLFLWAHYFDPHSAYAPPEPWDAAFADDPYGGEIAYVDACFGRLLEGISEVRSLENFVVVVTSDHGEGLGDHGEATHGIFVYEHAVRIPLLVAAPGGRVPAGTVSEVVRHIDLVPTILDLVGLPALAGIDGTSLLPLLDGRDEAPRIARFESFPLDYLYGWSKLFGGVAWPNKWIEAPRPECFDLRDNPRETRNLAEEKPDAVGPLRERVLEYAARRPEDAPARMRNLTSDEEARLRALGYLGDEGSAPRGDAPLLDPKDAVALAALLDEARNLTSEGRLDEAEAKAREVIARNPGNAEARACLATILFREERLEEALAENERALERNPTLASARRNVARIRLIRGELDLAEREYREAMRLEPLSIRAHLGLARTLLAKGDDASAETLLEAAAGLEPTDYASHYELAGMFERLGRDESALDSLERSVRARPSSPTPYLRMASIRARLGRLEEAERTLEDAARVFPGSPEVPARLGAILAGAGRDEAAQAAFARALALDPDFVEALVGSGMSLIRLGRLDEAGGALERAAAVNPDDPTPWKSLGILYGLYLGDAAAGERWLRRYLAERPDDREARDLLDRIRR